MGSFWTEVANLWAQGGFVMPWLVGSSLALWWAIGERAFTLRRGSRKGLDVLVESATRGPGVVPERGIVAAAIARVGRLAPSERDEGHVREAIADLLVALDRHRVLITSLAATAPLIGLLGTVSGMIETFDALTTMSFHSSSGGIAGGISEALISTQMGLAVAIPALLVGRLLDRTQHRLEDELLALPELFAAHQARAHGGA
jgi:biopolymer transport protein ExbB